jgi:cell division protein FtsW
MTARGATAVKSRPAAPARAGSRSHTRTRPRKAAGKPARAARVERKSERPAKATSGAASASPWASLRTAPTAPMLIVLVATLCVAGLVMVGSASSVVSLSLYHSAWVIFFHEVLWMAVGLMAFVVTMRVPYTSYRKLSRPLLVVTFLLVLVVLVPGIGVHASGSSRWIGYGQFRLQPSELMKLALVLFGADLAVRRSESGAGYRTLIGPLLIVTACAVGLVMLQPDMGTALVLVCVALALLFASGVPMGPVMKVLGGALVLAVLAGLASPYRRDRLFSFINPGGHASSTGYQVQQSLIGLGSGHLFGLGLGAGRQKWGLLPNAHTDFIFSVIGQELGLIGTLIVLALLATLAFVGLRAATRAPDLFGGLVAVGLVAFFAGESVINVGAAIGVLPVTGIPLPFISYGGSSLVITLAAAGILVNVARHERVPAAGTPLRSSRR